MTMESVIISTVRAIYRDTGMPAKTIAVATRCCVHRMTAWRWLRAAEEKQVIKRVNQRMGWLPANMN